jgi:hypothetical protein
MPFVEKKWRKSPVQVITPEFIDVMIISSGLSPDPSTAYFN